MGPTSMKRIPSQITQMSRKIISILSLKNLFLLLPYDREFRFVDIFAFFGESHQPNKVQVEILIRFFKVNEFRRSSFVA